MPYGNFTAFHYWCGAMAELLKIDDPKAGKSAGFAPFALGFRPFFIAAGVIGVLLVLLWLAGLPSGMSFLHYYPANVWHGHEMIYGYGVAVVAGFLLTAVGNWTGLALPTGRPLAALVALWLAGRIAALLPLPGVLIALVDAAFLPLLALVVARPLIRARNKNNYSVIAMLLLMTLGNVLVHLELNGAVADVAATGLMLGLYMLLYLLILVGGRIIPFFTEKGVGNGFKSRRRPVVEGMVFASLLVLIALGSAGVDPAYVGIIALFAASVNIIRYAGWYTGGMWKVPLLWILHLGYLWLIAGMLLQAAGAFGLADPALMLHAYGIGGLGALTLGMMARVAIGHTGRVMKLTSAWMVWSFALMILAGLVRVIFPLLPAMHHVGVVVSGLLWALAFAIFVAVYTPILIRPRVDGRPG